MKIKTLRKIHGGFSTCEINKTGQTEQKKKVY